MEDQPEDNDNKFNLPAASPFKIINYSNDEFHLDSTILLDIISGIDESTEKAEIAIVCVMGDEKSGKSFITNLILQNLNANGEGNWMGPITKQKEKLMGFSWNQDIKDNDMPSVDAWSRPFVLTRSNGEQVILLILNLSNSCRNSRTVEAFETLVWFLCSNVIINQLNNIDLRVLNSRNDVLKSNSCQMNAQRIIFAVQNFIQKNDTVVGKLSEQKLKKCVQDETLLTLWDGTTNKEGFLFPSPGKFIDSEGFLTLQPNFIKTMKSFIENAINEDEISSIPSTVYETVFDIFNNAVIAANKYLASVRIEPYNTQVTSRNVSSGNEGSIVDEAMKSANPEELHCPLFPHGSSDPGDSLTSIGILHQYAKTDEENCEVSCDSLTGKPPDTMSDKNSATSDSILVLEDCILMENNASHLRNEDSNTRKEEIQFSQCLKALTLNDEESSGETTKVTKVDNKCQYQYDETDQQHNLQKNVNAEENNEFQSTQKSVKINSSVKTETPSYFTIGTGNKQRKIEFDEKLQKAVQRIAEEFSNSVYAVMTQLDLENMSIKHTQHIPNSLFATAEEKLKQVCTDLKFGVDETQDKLKMLKTRLDLECKKTIAHLKRNHISNVDQRLKEPVLFGNEIISDNESTETNCKPIDHSVMDEKMAELIAMYQSKINTLLQTPESNEESIREFHSKESNDLLKQLCNFMQTQKNIFDSDKIQQDFLGKLEEEFSKYVPLCEEELVGENDGNCLVMETVKNLFQSSENLLKCYDEEMEKCLKGASNVGDIRNTHDLFIQKHLSEGKLLAMFHIPTPLQEELQIEPIEHYCQSILINRLQYYEKILESKLLAKNCMHKLVSSCSRGYQYVLLDEFEIKIKKTGFSPTSINTIVFETHNELVNHIAKSNSPEDSLVVEMEKNLQECTRDTVIKISSLFENVCKKYVNQMDEKFRQQNPLSSENLENVHCEVKKQVFEHFSKDINFKHMHEVSNSALNFAKTWYSNINTAIQQSENKIAFEAIKIVSQFHQQEMMKTLSNKSYTDRKLKELHNDLKSECISVFCKIFPFHQETQTHDLKNYSTELAAEIDLLYEECLKTNDRHREDRMKSIKSVASKSMQNFNLEMNRQLGDKSVTDTAFEKIYSEASNNVLKEMKKKFDELLLSESFHVYEKNMKKRMNIAKEEMATSNAALRKEELERVESKHDFLRKDEKTRGCKTPTLCVEFGPKIIRCAFYDKQDEFVLVKNDSGEVDIKNKITFLKTNEFILGGLSEENHSDPVYEKISLENVLKQKDEISRREINFQNGKLLLDLEILCSLILIRLREMAEKVAEETFSSIVISVPVWFTSRQRLALKSAARIAGFSENYLINETTAAALLYFKTLPEKPNSSVLVVSPDSDTCNAAVYAFDEGSVKMKSCFGDRHIKPKGGVIGYIWPSQDIYVTVVKEIIKSQKNLTNAVLLCEDESIMKNFREILSLDIHVSCNDGLKHLTLKGVGEYALRLNKNIHNAKSSILGITRYNFMYDTDVEQNVQAVHKNEPENYKGFNGTLNSNKHGKFKISLYEMSSNKTAFEYGDAEVVVKKNEKIKLKVKPNQEGTFDVLLTAGDALIEIGSSNLSEEKISDYLAMIERCFKKDPVQEALKQTKSYLHSIAKDMQDRFDQITAKVEMIRELIKKDIESALELSENPVADLETLQNKIKTLEGIREKRYPKSE